MKAVEGAADRERAKKKSGKPDPKKLFRLIQQKIATAWLLKLRNSAAI